MRKYEIHNQVTGLSEEASTFQDALILQEKIKQDFLNHYKDIFNITVLDQNADGSWTYAASDENGEPIFSSTEPPIPPNEETV
jgi:hypothetical protein